MLRIGVLVLLTACGSPDDGGPSTGTTPQGDRDGDGFLPPNDCDDADATVHPDAADEAGDGVDQDCDGVDGTDADGDGFAAPDDCDDAHPGTYPGAPDAVGDGVDEDCDGLDGVDADGDGFASEASAGDDCDDSDPLLTPIDGDGDGVSSCDGDCDDADVARWPGNPEICNAVDDDCDGRVDVDASDFDPCAAEEHLVAGLVVDVLVVVDNSFTMGDDQVDLAIAADELLTPLVGFAGLHLGVITTDMNDPQQSGALHETNGALYIDESFDLADAISWLGPAVIRGVGGYPLEMGRDAVFAAVDTLGAGVNAGFIRGNATLAVLFFSDDDDDSTGLSPAQFETWADGLKVPPATVSVNAIVSDDPACGVAEGTDYLGLTAYYGGLSYSICDADLQPDLAAIGASLVPPPFDGSLALAGNPDPATLDVTVTEPSGAVVLPVEGVDWTYDAPANAIVFGGDGYWPPQGASVDVAYESLP